MATHHRITPMIAITIFCLTAPIARADRSGPTQPLVRTVDLQIGQSVEVELCDGSQATVKLIGLHETRDEVCFAVRRAEVTVEVNGQQGELVTCETVLCSRGRNVGWPRAAASCGWPAENQQRKRPVVRDEAFKSDVLPVVRKYCSGLSCRERSGR